jgi:hypothetical protein
MVERTIEHTARELAGVFYDTVRSAESLDHKVQISRRGRIYLQIDPLAFRKTYPHVRDYIAGRKHGRVERDAEKGTVKHIDDGSVTMGTPGWMFWYDAARQQLVAMLANPMTHENIKAAITDALIEDREKQFKQEAAGGLPANIPQRRVIGERG